MAGLGKAKEAGHEPLEPTVRREPFVLQPNDQLANPAHLEEQRGARALIEGLDLLDDHSERPVAQHAVPEQVLEDKLGELGARIRPALEEGVQVFLIKAEEFAARGGAVGKLRGRVAQDVLAEEGSFSYDGEEDALAK